ncbi:GPP34 family phosphoprotein [Pseudarthrobacter sp. NPDC092439]|uniref:GOLPH3/VPS74 family protein n=1 Tax=unclassified Pseudarthrobacter TaxID=2647000 RepID=UPI00381628C1
MDAETPKAGRLNLPQAFLLLATNDADGKPEIPVFALRAGLAGAILAELDRSGAVELRGKHVRAAGAPAPPGFEHELELIRHKSRPHTPRAWVSMFEGRAVVQRVYEAMASLGIVERAGERHLGLFRTVRYPGKDHGPKAILMRDLESALRSPAAPPAGSVAPDARLLALIALSEASGLFGKLFPAADRVWADELAKDYWPSRAVEDELRLVRLAEEEAATL